MRVLITGMCGFAGHHVASYLLDETDWDLVGLDRIDATSSLHRLKEIPDWPQQAKRVSFVWHDLRAPLNPVVDTQIGKVDVVLHLAASTHVDRSITDPLSFVQDNVMGTAHILEWARGRTLDLFVNFCTDEVFGPAPNGVAYKEWDRFHPGNPYAAAKCGAAVLGEAFHNTYKTPVVTTFTMNLIGERQHPEKFVPLVIGKVLRGERIYVHADPTRTIPGSRTYLHARNVGAALRFLINNMPARLPFGERVNIVGERELSNLEVAQRVASILEKPLDYALVDFHSSRPGHDLRYALDGSLLASLGYTHPQNLDASLVRTVRWYVDHPEWLLM